MSGGAAAEPAPGPVLEVRSLTKRFTLHLRGGVQRDVLRDVSLSVHAGECLALVGPSGRGKSTLLKCLYGSYGAHAGAMRLRTRSGHWDLAQASAQEILALRRRDLAYVSQFLRVVPRVCALELVAQRCLEAGEADPLGTGPEPRDWGDACGDAPLARAREQARALLERLNLPAALWDLPPATFSGGEQQRVNVARGFVVPAQLLLLDEPTASLDAANRDVVVELIREAKAGGAAIVGIFHDVHVRDAVATRCLELA